MLSDSIDSMMHILSIASDPINQWRAFELFVARAFICEFEHDLPLASNEGTIRVERIPLANVIHQTKQDLSLNAPKLEPSTLILCCPNNMVYLKRSFNN